MAICLIHIACEDSVRNDHDREVADFGSTDGQQEK